jgi:hypothetical protein
MTRTGVFLTLAVSMVSLTLSAQTPTLAPPVLSYDPVICIKAEEIPVLQLDVREEGDLWAYFRMVNTTDWCSVEGINQGPLSSVRLPRFDEGNEIEYFFLLLEGKQVMARSPEVYRVKAMNRCDTVFARNLSSVPMMCGPATNSMPASMGAGYALRSQTLGDGSPFRPDGQ